MKKNVFLALATVVALSFAACNSGETKTEAGKADSGAAKTEAPKTEGKDTTGAATTATAGGDVDKAIDSYEALTTKYIDIMKKVKGGDASAAADAQKLTEEYTKAAQTLSTSTLTPAQTERMAAIAKKMQEAMTAK